MTTALDPATNQRNEAKRKGDGQRGHDEFYEYPKMLTKGLDHILVDDLDSEMAAIGDGWSTGAAPDPREDEIARLRAELAARDAGDSLIKRGPGRPRLTE